MRGVLVSETGGPEVLRVRELPEPEPGEGELLVRVRAAAVNPIDWKQRRGIAPKPLPAVLGNDFSGTVERSLAAGFEPGDEVFGFARRGAYAEYAVASAQALARKPSALSHVQAAAIPVSGLTAWQALFDHGGLRRSQTLLVAGAAGGVGHIAVQLGRHAGAHVIGTGSARNREFVLSLGAERYVDYGEQDVAEAVSGVDLAFDTVGGETTATLLPTVREGGALVTIAGQVPEAEAAARGVRAERFGQRRDAGQLRELAELAAAGELIVEVARTFPLERVALAHELSEAGHTRGKLILEP